MWFNKIYVRNSENIFHFLSTVLGIFYKVKAECHMLRPCLSVCLSVA